MGWVLVVLALTATGPSVATHDFDSREVCQSVAGSVVKEFQSYRLRAVCLPK